MAAIWAISLYQKTLSPDHGPRASMFPYGFCRFRPTCSEYACHAISDYGLIKGGFMSLWRVLRCNPLSKGGWDPVRSSGKCQVSRKEAGIRKLRRSAYAKPSAGRQK